MKHNSNRPNAGFTLIELIAVLVLIGVFSAVAVPSMLSFVEEGKQRNRMNIARTIYLAAQDRLTELKITKNLKSELTGQYYDNTDGRYTENAEALKNNKNVYKSLNDYLPAEDINNGNKDYIHYISKPKGVNDPSDPVIRLLDPVILDKMILNDAILIEYNIKTGVVLSAFYGDILNDNEQFGYLNDGSNRDIFGVRPYGNAYERKQGYYGAGSTGASEDDLPPTLINVYDSYSRSLPDDTSHDLKNILYAEILIPQKLLGSDFDLLINDKTAESAIPLATQTNGITSLSQALVTYNTNPNTALIYRYDGNINKDVNGSAVPAGQEYARIIWILDYVGSDMTSGNNTLHSIGVKYAGNIANDSNLRVGINGSVSADSLTEAHPYFYTESSYKENSFAVMSARHLYNIRYLEYGNFTQKDDIDLSSGIAVTNFEPIPDFSGTYSGEGYEIRNLVINLPSENNIGLFGRISGNKILNSGVYDRASVIGLTLDNPDISGGSNTGSVCGVLNGFITGIYVKYTDENKTVSGSNNVGGIAGLNEGMLTDSAFISPTAREHISGANKSTTGGIAGSSIAGGLQRTLFLAIAPKNSTVINPFVGNSIAGVGTGSDSKLYYLSGTAVRPGEVPAHSGKTDYNIEKDNGIGEKIGTAEIYETFIGSVWTKTAIPLTVDETLNPDNTVYPYPYAKYSENVIARHPNWPIADAGQQISQLTYYELYNDNSWGYSSAGTLTSSKIVVNDGYAVDFSFYRGEYRLELGGTVFKITGTGTEDNAVWLIQDNADNTLLWPAPKPFVSAGGELMFRLYIPNDVFEQLSGNTVRLSLFKGALTTPILSSNINPLFAPPASGLIRSPRHLYNISKALNGTYIQQLNLDFSIYFKGLTDKYTVDPSTKLPAAQSVVSGTFTGSYDGNGKSVLNITVNSASNYVGLFSQNNGTIRNVTMQNVDITGGYFVGGIAGAASKDSVITDCKLSAVKINSVNFAGGITGRNEGTITRSFVGMNAAGNSSENNVTSMIYAGGIAGSNMGIIDLSYVEYTRVGFSNAAYVGGIAGYLDGGQIKNVFYNYGNAAPQASNFSITITGLTQYTGGLVGYINAGTLTNAYSDAYFGSGSNLLIGGKATSAAVLNATVLYLKESSYNSGVSTLGGSVYSTLNLQSSTAVTALNAGGSNWQPGSSAGGLNPLTYTYPRLSVLEEPKRWPMPNAMLFNFKYYEIYPDINPKTGGKYGLWSSSGDDQLDYTQKVLEDGYVLYGVNSPGNSGDFIVRSFNGQTLGSGKTRSLISTSSLGGTPCIIFNLDTLEGYMRLSGAGIEPVRVTIGQGNAQKGDYFDGYINPLFARSIYSLTEINRLGTTAQQQAYFKNTNHYIIRTPRHLNNIGFDASTLAGRFDQEIDIDFGGLNTNSGYYRTPNVNVPATKTNINIHASVVSGVFTGRYTAKSPYDNQIKAIKNMTLPNPAPAGTTAQPQPGNIGIFSQIGAGGIVENVILKDNTVSGTSGSVGGLAGINEGTISYISAINTKVQSTTGKAGCITGESTGTIANISVVDSGHYAPVTAANDAGGITALNSGTITSVLYLAHAPLSNPIVHENRGTIASAYYLSGTYSAINRPAEYVSAAAYNGFIAAYGTPRTAQELNALSLSGWSGSNSTSNVLTSVTYPYPYIFSVPMSWPVASTPADNVAYYEKYNNGNGTFSYGYYSPKTGDVILSGLIDDKPIAESGYCVIMPTDYNTGRTIKLNTRSNVPVELIDGKNIVKITQAGDVTMPALITVNDIPTGLYINTAFAKCVYTTAAPVNSLIVRTPQQMLSIGKLDSTKSLTFTQERDFDFTGIVINGGAIVTGEFTGTFDGNGKIITCVTINAPNTDNVGLFSQNSGTIKNITLKSNTNITGRNNVGGIAGHNLGADSNLARSSGIIDNCSVEGDFDSGAYTGMNISGNNNIGGIAGLNDGTITGCSYNGTNIHEVPSPMPKRLVPVNNEDDAPVNDVPTDIPADDENSNASDNVNEDEPQTLLGLRFGGLLSQFHRFLIK